MKQLGPFQITISIAVILLYVIIITGLKKTEADLNNEKPDLVPVSSAGLVIAYVNTDTLWDNFEMVKVVKDELEKEKAVFESNFQSRYRALEKDVANFQETAPRLSQETGAAMQQELMQKEQALAQYKDELSTKLINKEQAKNQEIQDTIISFINRYNKTRGYTYILGKGAGAGILYANDTLDITSEVVRGLNSEYKAANPRNE